MTRKYQVISADGHVETPPDGWHKYVPAKWKDRAPRLVPLPSLLDFCKRNLFGVYLKLSSCGVCHHLLKGVD